MFDDWEAAAAALLAGFRRSVGRAVDGARVVELVGELSVASPEFRQLWARHDIAERTGANFVLHHPTVGPLHLDREKLAISGTDGIVLVIHHPHAGSDTAERLALLSATRDRVR